MKRPSFQFYPGDHRKDPQLAMCSPATRGIWVDALCAMHENSHSGVLTGTLCQLARALGVPERDMQAALDELKSTRAADVHEHDGVITLINRRMRREARERKQSARRQANFRAREAQSVTRNAKVCKSNAHSKSTQPPVAQGVTNSAQKSNAEVTPYSSSSPPYGGYSSSLSPPSPSLSSEAVVSLCERELRFSPTKKQAEAWRKILEEQAANKETVKLAERFFRAVAARGPDVPAAYVTTTIGNAVQLTKKGVRRNEKRSTERKHPPWALQKMQKAIKYAEDSLVGRSSWSKGEFEDLVQVGCTVYGVEFSWSLYRMAGLGASDDAAEGH